MLLAVVICREEGIVTAGEPARLQNVLQLRCVQLLKGLALSAVSTASKIGPIFYFSIFLTNRFDSETAALVSLYSQESSDELMIYIYPNLQKYK